MNRDPLGHFKVMNVFYDQIAMDNDCQLDVCTVFAAVYAADGNNICSIAGRTIGANFVTGKSVSTIVISNIDGLAACGNNNTNNTEPSITETPSAATSEPETTEHPTTDTSETEAADTESTGGKTLVVYYSASGNTENVSNVIAKTLGADLFELEPVEPYSNDDLNWTNDDSRVTREHENEDERDVELVSATVDNWSEYDTVFIGYPIWWGIAAWPVDEFIETNDFTGKTVIPFATSASSGMGQSGELLAEMAGTGDWQEGQRFRSGASEDDIVAWVEGLGL